MKEETDNKLPHGADLEDARQTGEGKDKQNAKQNQAQTQHAKMAGSKISSNTEHKRDRS